MNPADRPFVAADAPPARRPEQHAEQYQAEVRRTVEAQQIAPDIEVVRHYARATALSAAPAREAVLLTRYAAALSQDPTVALGSPELVRDVAQRARRIVQDAGVTSGMTPQQLLRTATAAYETVAKVAPIAAAPPAVSGQPTTALKSGIGEATTRLRNAVTAVQPATRLSHQDPRQAPTARPTTPSL